MPKVSKSKPSSTTPYASAAPAAKKKPAPYKSKATGFKRDPPPASHYTHITGRFWQVNQYRMLNLGVDQDQLAALSSFTKKLKVNSNNHKQPIFISEKGNATLSVQPPNRKDAFLNELEEKFAGKDVVIGGYVTEYTYGDNKDKKGWAFTMSDEEAIDYVVNVKSEESSPKSTKSTKSSKKAKYEVIDVQESSDDEESEPESVAAEED